MPTISGTVLDDAGDPVAGRVVRVYSRTSGQLMRETVSGNGSGYTGDANFLKVAALMPLETDVQDRCGKLPGSFALVGGAALTSGGRFGAGCLDVVGAGQYLGLSGEYPIGLGNADFTAEFWVNTTSVITYGGLFSIDGVSGQDFESLVFTIGGVFATVNGTAWTVFALSTGAINDGSWHHVAVTRAGSSLRTFRDGVLISTSTALGTSPLFAKGSTSVVGKKVSLLSEAISSQINGVRITKGLARYTANFTAPSAMFVPRLAVGALATGEYSTESVIADEVDVVCLDDAGGTTYNDLILRTTPV
jgi:hypothetical protein